MAEYIKREDAMSHPFANGKYDHKNASIDFILGHESYKEWLETLPAADVVEVVRCRDCKYATMTYDGLCKYCEIHSPNEAAYYDGDFYCAYGERSENND